MTSHTAALTRRLAHVEVRKFVDTRASRWILVSLGVVATVMAVGAVAIGHGASATANFTEVVAGMQMFTALAAALIGILGMTGDWAHGVTTTYFPLVQRRSYIYAAKLGAALLVCAVMFLATIAAALAAVGIYRVTTGGAVRFDDAVATIGLSAVSTLLGVVFGIGVAAVIRRVALSIVAVIGLTVGVNVAVLGFVPQAWQGVLSTLTPLAAFAPVDKPAAYEVLGSLLVWYVIPILAGWRIAERAEA